MDLAYFQRDKKAGGTSSVAGEGGLCVCIKLSGGPFPESGGAAGGARRHLECKMCKKEGAAGLRQSRKRWHAFFQRHAVHHISRCSMP